MSHTAEAVVVPPMGHFGWSAGADLVYRSVVRSGPSTAAEVERRLGMSAGRVAAALSELAARGAVRLGGSRTGRDAVWRPAPPAEVLAEARRRRPAARHPESVRYGRLAATLLDQPTVLDDGIRHLPTRAAARSRLARLNAVVRHEHLAMTPEATFDAESARSAVPMDRLVLGRGARMRVLGRAAPDLADPLELYGRDPGEPCPEYRGDATIPMKLILVDRSVALFPVDPADLERGYLEVTRRPIVAELVGLFEQHWNSADVKEPALPEIVLGPRERALVTLLAAGHSDESAAKELRISRRSVSYALRTLMDQAGVENRFQLGLALGALGAARPSLADTEATR
jgi:DNA-binding CsgD family transcriptional regulator